MQGCLNFINDNERIIRNILEQGQKIKSRVFASALVELRIILATNPNNSHPTLGVNVALRHPGLLIWTPHDICVAL